MVGWTYTPLKARNGPRRGHACETAEPQQDSGPTGGQVVCRAAAIWAPSNPLKAKVVGGAKPWAAPLGTQPNRRVKHLALVGWT